MIDRWRALVGPVALVACVIIGAGCADDDGSEDMTCKERCRAGTGGPPVNDCLVVGGSEACVYTCDVDADCFDQFYPGGCSALADNGTAICDDSLPDAG